MTMQSDNTPAQPRGWFKASASASNGCCVEVLENTDIVRIRDTKWTGGSSEQPIISVSADAWTGFLAEVRRDG